MPSRKNIPCDYNKLEREFAKRGLKMGDAAEQMGYAKTMLYPSKVDGGLTKPMAVMLKNMFNIGEEAYAPDKKETEVAAPVNGESFEDIKDELYKVIYAAVYEAVKKAWGE